MCAKLKSISLQNFRVFSSETQFDFKNINIITGPNNSGKSSLIKALLLLQDHYVNEWSVLNFDKGNHNLISFEHTINNESHQKFFKINLGVRASEDLIVGVDDILGIELIFKQINDSAILTQAKCFNVDGYLVTASELVERDNDITNYYIPPNWFISSCPLSMDEIMELADISVSIPRRRSGKTAIPRSLSQILSHPKHFINYLLSNGKTLSTELFRGHEIPEAIKQKLANLTLDMVLDFDRLPSTEFKPQIYHFFNAHNLRYEPAVRNQQLSVYPFNHSFARSLANLMAIKSHYDPKSEETRFVNKWIGKDGFNIMQEIDGMKIERINGAGYAFSFFRNGNSIDLTNLGSGAAQVLPVLIQIITVVGLGSTIMLEEPEANLHPNFQSKLAELIVEASGDPFGHQFIVETHSEYLIRKLQYLVATRRVASEDVQIYYFNDPQTAKESKLNQVVDISIFDNGGLSQNFGEGFFDEASMLRFKLLEINNAQKN